MSGSGREGEPSLGWHEPLVIKRLSPAPPCARASNRFEVAAVRPSAARKSSSIRLGWDFPVQIAHPGATRIVHIDSKLAVIFLTTKFTLRNADVIDPVRRQPCVGDAQRRSPPSSYPHAAITRF